MESACQSAHLSVIVFSREESKIRKAVSQYRSTDLTTEFLETDTRAFTRYDVESRLWSVGDQTMKERIVSTLSEKADDMFLCVRFMVDYLRSYAVEAQLESFLSNLPMGLDNAYKRILRRVSTEPLPLRQRAARFLRWVARAARLLLLDELTTAFAIQKGQPSLNNDARPSAPREVLTQLWGSFAVNDARFEDTIYPLERNGFLKVLLYKRERQFASRV
ncbi:MAG: hypothetical protein Q9201_007253 [Fulgogasparrea decipioides]